MLTLKNIGSLVKFVDRFGKQHIGNIDFIDTDFNTVHLVVDNGEYSYGEGGIAFNELEVLKLNNISDDELEKYNHLSDKVNSLQNDWNNDLISDDDFYENIGFAENELNQYVESLFVK